MSFRQKPLFVILSIAAVVVLLSSQFMVIKVRENSMAPTLIDGQWALVLRGAEKVRTGDVAVFVSPIDQDLAVKRCVLSGSDVPMVDHGWLITPWGNWFLTGNEWNRLSERSSPLPDSVFMVGDNQFRSTDSRIYGYVSRDRLVGRVVLRRAHG